MNQQKSSKYARTCRCLLLRESLVVYLQQLSLKQGTSLPSVERIEAMGFTFHTLTHKGICKEMTNCRSVKLSRSTWTSVWSPSRSQANCLYYQVLFIPSSPLLPGHNTDIWPNENYYNIPTCIRELNLNWLNILPSSLLNVSLVSSHVNNTSRI